MASRTGIERFTLTKWERDVDRDEAAALLHWEGGHDGALGPLARALSGLREEQEEGGHAS